MKSHNNYPSVGPRLKQLRLAIEHCPVALILADRGGRIVLANRLTGKIFGYRKKELLLLRVERLVPASLRRAHVMHRRNFHSHASPRRMGMGRDLRGVRKNGKEFAIEVGLKPLMIEGQAFVLAAIVDITKRRQMEGALKRQHHLLTAMYETTHTLTMILDRMGRVVLFSRACERLTGYGRKEMFGKLVWRFLISREDKAIMQRVFDKVAAGGDSSSCEVDWLIHTGSARRIAWMSTALLDPERKVEFVLMTGTDMTERRLLERQILDVRQREQKRVAEELHDGLGQELAAAAVAAKILQSHFTDQTSDSSQDADRVMTLINQAISRTRQIAQGFYKQDMLPEGLETSIRCFGVDVEKQFGVTCIFRYDSSVTIPDIMRANNLYRIVREAVSNAVRHGQARQIEIKVIQRKFLEAELRIENDGKCFVRTRRKTSGIGLSIMRSRAEAIGGRLRILSRSQGGTVVSCVFKTNASG